MKFLDFHPWDWMCHFILSFVPVRLKWCHWILAFSVGVGVEYEQKTQVCYNDLSWSSYIQYESSGDLIADFSGAVFAHLLNDRDKKRMEQMRLDDFMNLNGKVYTETK